MLTATDQNVLEAIANSLEFEVYSVESSEGRETLHGLSWERLQLATGLTTRDLEAATIRLAAAGLIACGDNSDSVFDWLLGERPATFFWATQTGHRLIIDHNEDIEQRPENRVGMTKL